uniref:Heat shock protein hsp90B n=1 Tax=Ettlia sp. YC001 TaxID=1191503 RepID=A0A411H946_9CHLO|nr:heat shock protein hsp90B [Ettlia sp. YC001]
MMKRTRVVLLAALCAACLVAGALAADAAADSTDSPKVNEAVAGKSKGTDAAAPERENMGKMTSPSFQRKIRENAQKFEFQAEVNRLMDILIHSLYSHKDIFLRELISNASDALDKIRFLSLTDKSVLGEGSTAALEIRIWADKENRQLFIRDRGIGMTRDELVKNLGTIAKSGTSAFLEQMQKGGDINLIGQFGVGFYSVYLVADWVEVVTKAPGDKQYIWASGADGAFSVSEDNGENEDLGRGTLIKIHLKEGSEEYADEARLKSLVHQYSEFINFPIYLQSTKEKEVPVEEDEEAEPAKNETTEEADKTEDEDKKDEEDEGDVVDEDEEESTDEEKKPKTVKQNVTEWEHLNDNKAIWLRKPKDISDEEYNKFYKAVSKDYDDALTNIHFKAEGDVEFKALMFIPKRAPWDFYDNIQRPKPKANTPGASSPAGLKLYVRRVFISDDVDTLLPRYLSFLRGVVDSDSLPLNVNREMLQVHSSLKTIKKKLVRKTLDAIKKMADDEIKCKASDDSDSENSEKPSTEECERFGTFWKEFGKALKLGILEDDNNRGRLAKLLRFHSSKSPKNFTSLADYVSRVKPGQKTIYWIAGLSQDEVARSPFAEKLVAEGYEVLYLTDVLDEYVMQQLTEFEDFKFANIAKEDVELDESEDAKKAAKEAAKALKDTFKPLTSWWKEQLGSKVSGVKLSKRLASTPCVVVASKWGQSANMERIMRASAFSDPARAAMMRGQRTLEINPDHPLIIGLKDKVISDKDDEAAKATAALLYETALLESGFELDDAKDFSKRMYELIKEKIGVTADLPSSSSSTSDDEPAEAPASAAAANKDVGDDTDKSEL